jgi:predicted PurR-regulated permease PerM
MRTLEDKTLLVLVAAVTVAFAWILAPFSGTILWAVVLAILFTPLYRRLLTREGRTIAALETLLVVVVIVIVPVSLLGGALLEEAVGVYQMIHSGQLDFGHYIQQIYETLPSWVLQIMERSELTDLDAFRDRLSASFARSSQYLASQAFSVGQNTLTLAIRVLVMLYLLFFLLRDGDELIARIRGAIPLRDEQQRALLTRLAVVIRATVKGNLVVALLQGALGALAFWFLGIRAPLLWGSLMAVLSLLPLVGAILVWGPAAVYYFATGALWQGVFLVAYGFLVISMVDNILRPLLVRKETKLPDYLVLLSTFGGLAVFGINGFIVGPVIAAIFVTVWDIFATTRTAGP